MSKVTIVSALFNIDRVDGRKWHEYMEWFETFLELKAPMILFTTEDIAEFIKEKRGELPTNIVLQTIEEMPYHHLKDEIQDILDSDQYKESISDPDRIECKQAMYSVIQYSKFPWLKIATELDPYDSDFFFWLDAGGSRFFGLYDLKKEYPSEEAVKSLEEMGESFLVQQNTEFYPDLSDAEELDLDYLYDNRSYVLGSMFGGHKNVVPKICDMVEDIFINEMINKGNVNNEQIALGYLIKKYPDEFSTYERTNGKHMALFEELG